MKNHYVVCDCGEEINYVDENNECIEEIICPKCGKVIFWVAGTGYMTDSDNGSVHDIDTFDI